MSRNAKEEIRLSDHFTYGRLLRFTLPSIAMMIFTSIYGVVDGIFVSNYVGETPFAALNLIMPYIMLFTAVGTMFGTGGSALVAFTLGAGDRKKANEIFSLILYFVTGLGALFMVIGIVFAEPASKLLGADEAMLPYCVQYARICFVGAIPFSLQYVFQSFFITAEKPKLGLYVTVLAGVTNMFLDWLLVGVLRFGLAGAAWATVTGTVIGGVIPLIYFLMPNTSLLRLGRARWYGKALIKSATNGSSEFLSNVSMSIVNMLYNFQLMKFAGESGVAAYGIIMYTNFIFIGYFFGYSMGVAPVVGFDHGAGNTDELKNVFKRSVKLIAVSSLIVTALSILSARLLAMIFASANPDLLEMTTTAIRIYSISYLFTGINLFGSSFFTALNNGKISALISFMRVLVLQILFVLILPQFLEITGIWLSIVMAELCAVVLTGWCLVRNRKRYGYA
ncbi:MAG: MATE family efflux transporter [Lachnospiraceae bacterium]|nr:MATE family efflux transporter [Lachnospiraceae bacterium]